MKYTCTNHAAERLIERRKGKAWNVYEAATQCKKLAEESVMTRKQGHRPNIRYLLNIKERLIFVVNTDTKVIITVYGVLK